MTIKSSTPESFQNYSLEQILTNQSVDADVTAPLFFRLGNDEDRDRLRDLLHVKPYIKIFDTIGQQLSELVKSLFPKRTLSAAEITRLKEDHLKGVPEIDYGVWVYYPWNEKLIHLLDEEEFSAMRTNRNRYKITPAEQAALAKKKIGVIGLSVGQSVSLALSMERGYGELRIADFDELEITNLNRLRSGVHNMGLKKTVIVAREIAEIDPFLKVTCFSEGITSDNLETFLLQDGKLDLLIDECDGVEVKVMCRLLAKRHRIPVLMEASDRGTVDVERFDLEPDRPILHGFVEHLDLSGIKEVKTNEEKLPYILAFAGVETLSTRMKASAIEVGQTISTWPQLASAVVMGGGIVADVCRRVLLDQFHQSGRYFVDLEELIGDPKEPTPSFTYTQRSLSAREMIDIATRMPASDTTPESDADEMHVRALVEAASLAPSPGNNQPWKWYYDGRQLYLFHDIERSESYGDFQNMAAHMALGTAIENMSLKANELGLAITQQILPLADEPLLIGVFSFKKAKPAQNNLAAYIGKRCTNRNMGDGREIDADTLTDIRRSIEPIAGVKLRLIGAGPHLEQVATITGRSDKLRLFIPQGHYELFEKELRWSTEDVEATKDGLDIRTLELTGKDQIGFRVARDPRAIQLVSTWKLGAALENISSKSVTSSMVGLITMPSFDAKSCVEAGRAVERLWLTASKHRISLHPLLASVLHFARLRYGNGSDMPPDIKQEFITLEQQFNTLFGIDPATEVPLFLFRLFRGKDPDVRSLRLDIADVLVSGGVAQP